MPLEKYENETDESKTKRDPREEKGLFPFLSARVPHGGFRSSEAGENPGERRSHTLFKTRPSPPPQHNALVFFST